MFLKSSTMLNTAKLLIILILQSLTNALYSRVIPEGFSHSETSFWFQCFENLFDILSTRARRCLALSSNLDNR